MYPPPPGASPILGMEVSGIVEHWGRRRNAEIGDEICALLPGGGYAEYAVASALWLLPRCRAVVTLVDAAALPEVHFTVWTNLIDSARLSG